MTVTYVTTVTSGAGPLFSYAADADSLVILSTGALLSTSGTAISSSRADVNLHVYGTVASLSSLPSPAPTPRSTSTKAAASPRWCRPPAASGLICGRAAT